MAEHPNVALARKGYDAFASFDLDSIRDLFSDDVVFHIMGNHRFSGTYKGKDEVFGLFSESIQFTGGTLKNTVHDIVGNDEHVVVLAQVTGEAEGRRLDTREAHIMHVKDGRVVEWWDFYEDDAVVNEFFGS